MYKMLCRHVFTLGSLTRDGIAESNSDSMSKFLKNRQTVFAQSLYHFTLPRTMCIEGFQVFHIFTTCLFVYSRHTRCEVVTHCGFKFNLPNDDEHFFLCFLAICLLWRNVSSSPLSI